MSEKIKIVFLGTSDAVPTPSRNHTAILLSYKGENILIDCGEGTQRQFRKAKINQCKLTKILVTHWHADHILGIPGLLQTLALNEYNKPLEIYGPKGTKKFMKKILETFVFRGKHPLKIKEVKGKFLETKDFFLGAKSMTHGTPCNGYTFAKKGEIKIDKKKLEKTNIAFGKWLQKLKQGKDIVYKGKKYKAEDLTFKEEDKKISFILDTSMNKKIVSFVKNSDLLICESSFGENLKEKAKEYKHLTASQAAQIAKKANVKKLVLTHLGQRYEKNKKDILKEAKKVFKNVCIAEDFDKLEI